MDIRIFESKILSSVTGSAYDVGRLWEAGERIYNLRRAIMVHREDRRRKGDDIAHVWFERTVIDPTSPPLAAPLDRKSWDQLLTRYYSIRGWDAENGRPLKAKLEALGMSSIAATIGTTGAGPG